MGAVGGRQPFERAVSGRFLSLGYAGGPVTGGGYAGTADFADGYGGDVTHPRLPATNIGIVRSNDCSPRSDGSLLLRLA